MNKNDDELHNTIYSSHAYIITQRKYYMYVWYSTMEVNARKRIQHHELGVTAQIYSVSQ